ncbi:MAG: RNase adapter RapZ [Elusimicrobiaceae bacterium]
MAEAVKKLFTEKFGEEIISVEPFAADGSDRKLFRIKSSSRSVIGVENGDLRENDAFLSFSRHFRSQNLPVPEIYADSFSEGCYLEQDLGPVNLYQTLSRLRTPADPFPDEVLALYRKAVQTLPRFQIAASRGLDYSKCYPRAAFDRQSMMWDLNYFKYYFLRLAKVRFSEQPLEDDFNKFADFLLEAPRDFFLYRDFQSRNIMVQNGELSFIDYQGGRKGALQYDIASLLFDAKADIPFEIREGLLDLYLDAVSSFIKVDREDFLARYYGYAYIRIMQAMGAYGLRGFYEKKAHFLQSIPYAVKNLEYLLNKAALPLDIPELQSVWRQLAGSTYLRQFGAAKPSLVVRVQSFSFRMGGVPLDESGHGGGYVFDCRALPNPGRYAQYATLTGRDAPVIGFLEKEAEVARFLESVYALVDQSLENYRTRNFTSLTVSFGCTGGRHRSVYCAESLAKHLRAKYNAEVELIHNIIGGGL